MKTKHKYRPADGLAKLAAIPLWAYVTLSIWVAVIYASEAIRIVGIDGTVLSASEWYLDARAASLRIAFVVLIVAGAMCGLWTYRVVANVRSFPGVQLWTYTPMRSALIVSIPIVNLIGATGVIKEVWNASRGVGYPQVRPRLSWIKLSALSKAPEAWGTFLLAGFTGSTFFAVKDVGFPADGTMSPMLFLAAGSLMALMCGVVAAYTVRLLNLITAMQNKRAEEFHRHSISPTL